MLRLVRIRPWHPKVSLCRNIPAMFRPFVGRRRSESRPIVQRSHKTTANRPTFACETHRPIRHFAAGPERQDQNSSVDIKRR